MMLTVEVPGRPVPKGRPRFTRAGRAYTPTKTRRYEAWVRAHAAKSRVIKVHPRTPWPRDARYSVDVTAYVRSEKTRGDVDNFVKAALDGCTGVLWHDDHQVVEQSGRRVVAERGQERLVISVRVLP